VLCGVVKRVMCYFGEADGRCVMAGGGVASGGGFSFDLRSSCGTTGGGNDGASCDTTSGGSFGIAIARD
jgi:hypothetical protein